jgi:hypothetical protein
MLFLVPAIEILLVGGIDIGHHQQQALWHRALLG